MRLAGQGRIATCMALACSVQLSACRFTHPSSGDSDCDLRVLSGLSSSARQRHRAGSTWRLETGHSP